MKLEGSLDAFSLPDVFQLLSLTKKSGGLHLANGQSAGIVYFQSGAVTGACSDASRQSLARRLVGLGACDDAALRRAVDRAVSERVGVARALAEANAVDPELLNRLAREQAVDAVFDLLRWTDGEFAFGIDEPNPDEVGLAVADDEVVSEANTRRETWEAVSRIIPSPEVVLTMPVVVPEDPAISTEEWALLALVDGQRSVGGLVEVSGAGQFIVVSTLATLVQRGMLVLLDEDSPDHVTVVRRRHQLLTPLEQVAPNPAEQSGAEQPGAEQPGIEQPVSGQPDSGQPVVEQTGAGQPGTSSAPVVPPTGQPVVAPSHPGVNGGVSEPGMAPTTARPLETQPVDPATARPAAAAADTTGGPTLGGAHEPTNVVPPRPEPFMPKRVVEHPEPGRAGFGPPPGSAPTSSSVSTAVSGGAAAAAQPMGESAIERDPTVNRSLMLRLIAGVRGL